MGGSGTSVVGGIYVNTIRIVNNYLKVVKKQKLGTLFFLKMTYCISPKVNDFCVSVTDKLEVRRCIFYSILMFFMTYFFRKDRV